MKWLRSKAITRSPALQEILSYYSASNSALPYVFPLIKRDALELQYKDVKWARKRHNKNLWELIDGDMFTRYRDKFQAEKRGNRTSHCRSGDKKNIEAGAMHPNGD